MEKVTSKDGTEIAFDRVGEGPPLVVVGGALNDRENTAELAEMLAPHATVFNYDRRGRGDSGDTAPYAVQREIEDLQAIIDEAGGSAMLFAHCTAGMLALEAVAQGLPITRLALYEPPYIVGDSGLRLTEEFKQLLTEHLDKGEPGEAVAHFLIRTVGFPPEAVPKFRAMPIWPKLEKLAVTLPYDVTLAADNWMPPQTRLDEITLPSMLIYGTNSPGWQIESVKVLAEKLPNSETRVLEGSNHDLEAESVAPVLKEFVAAARSARSGND
ncbi:MAG: alpha/beta hydrolase [Actinobacteria bacterium]|nr:alpha/beta hydrolase [Actinomycetota bacterium]